MLRLAVPTVLLTLAAQPATADTCSPARAMVILDKSSSMQTGEINGVTKWSTAVTGLGDVLSAYDNRAEFGLMTFPSPSQCAPGAVDVAPAMNNRGAILGALTTPPPNAGSWTPMAQTLEVAATEPALLTGPAGSRHVILITDGWQYCSPYDPATRFDGVEAVAKLRAAGITTWVVGFGAEVDSLALNDMAVTSGTERVNCNAAQEDPSAADNCYFQVNNATELVAALDTIAQQVTADELCDGVDNDCDGQVDEDLVRDCTNACGGGSETCNAGVWGECTAPASSAEVCDGEDNDCNGQVDDAAACGPTNPDDGSGAMHAGCSCETSAPLDASALAPFAMLMLLLVRRRR